MEGMGQHQARETHGLYRPNCHDVLKYGPNFPRTITVTSKIRLIDKGTVTKVAAANGLRNRLVHL